MYMYRIFKYYISEHTRVMQSDPYEAANKINDIVKLLNAILLSSSAGLATMKEARTRCMTGNRERLGKEIGHIVQAADVEGTKVSLADAVPDPV
jgi:hypothetical protein